MPLNRLFRGLAAEIAMGELFSGPCLLRHESVSSVGQRELVGNPGATRHGICIVSSFPCFKRLPVAGGGAAHRCVSIAGQKLVLTA
jgi:hypothetical protein